MRCLAIVVLACSTESTELNSGLKMGLQWNLSMEHLHLGALRAQLVEVVLNFHLNFHFFFCSGLQSFSLWCCLKWLASCGGDMGILGFELTSVLDSARFFEFVPVQENIPGLLLRSGNSLNWRWFSSAGKAVVGDHRVCHNSLDFIMIEPLKSWECCIHLCISSLRINSALSALWQTARQRNQNKSEWNWIEKVLDSENSVSALEDGQRLGWQLLLC